MSVILLPKNFFRFSFNMEDVYSLITDPFYIDSESITIINNEGMNSYLPMNSLSDRATYLKNMFLQGSTLILRNLASYNDEFESYIQLMGKGTTAHCYVNPIGGRSYIKHSDPEDVLLIMQQGSKTLLYWDQQTQKEVRLTVGDSVYIEGGTPHEAINETACIALSLGTGILPGQIDPIDKKDFLERMRC